MLCYVLVLGGKAQINGQIPADTGDKTKVDSRKLVHEKELAFKANVTYIRDVPCGTLFISKKTLIMSHKTSNVYFNSSITEFLSIGFTASIAAYWFKSCFFVIACFCYFFICTGFFVLVSVTTSWWRLKMYRLNQNLSEQLPMLSFLLLLL